MKYALGNISLLIILALLFTACYFNMQFVNRQEDEKDAEKITNQFYDLIRAGEYEETIPLCSKRFIEKYNREKLVKLYTSINERLGELKVTKLQSWQTRVVKGATPSGDYMLVYNNKREKFDAVETLVLSLESDGIIRIVAYSVGSEGLLN